MRAFVFLSALALATAQGDTGTCMVNGAEAVSDAMDASMFIWASIARCGQTGEQVKCEIGVSSAITAVNSMVNVILKAVNQCGALNTVNADCGMSVSMLTQHAGGIASSSGGIAQKCFQGPAHGLNWNHADPAMCVVNVKNTAKNFFKVVKSFLKMEKTGACASGDSNACAENALQIVGAFAGIGEFLAGAIGKCSPSGAHKGAVCAQQTERLVQQMVQFSERAIDVSEKCTAEKSAPERLYSMQAKQIGNGAGSSYSSVLLAAFLPVAAIVGFVGGRVYGSRSARATSEVTPMTDGEF